MNATAANRQDNINNDFMVESGIKLSLSLWNTLFEVHFRWGGTNTSGFIDTKRMIRLLLYFPGMWKNLIGPLHFESHAHYMV